jgi:lipopolysaccharide transport system ATP-binding protein
MNIQWSGLERHVGNGSTRNPIIRCRGVGKCYRVSQGGQRGAFRYRALRDELVEWSKGPLRWWRGDRAKSEEFWALQDIDFVVQPGEVVGIIGRNGAGKSTLLKIFSKITKPSVGEVRLRGRVGSLLEVGTGFHPELTGRENIFLNGSILGMKRAEIAAKFDQIVQFAEVERFLDTPVKRYSSGMYVRLAFAVAAHLQPEILIVDEVLAVGDMAFQRKCLGRMREVGKSGCTVLFVSHSMPAVESLCTRALLLDGGRLVKDGNVPDLIQEYHKRVLQPASGTDDALAQRSGPDRAQKVYQTATLLDDRGQPTNFLPLGGLFHLRLGLDAATTIESPTIVVGIDDTLGHRLLSLLTPLTQPVFERIQGKCQVDCRVPNFPLAPGQYWIKLGLRSAVAEVDEVERVMHFSVTDADKFGEGRGIHQGLCVAPAQWTVQRTAEQ